VRFWALSDVHEFIFFELWCFDGSRRLLSCTNIICSLSLTSWRAPSILTHFHLLLLREHVSLRVHRVVLGLFSCLCRCSLLSLQSFVFFRWLLWSLRLRWLWLLRSCSWSFCRTEGLLQPVRQIASDNILFQLGWFEVHNTLGHEQLCVFLGACLSLDAVDEMIKDLVKEKLGIGVFEKALKVIKRAALFNEVEIRLSNIPFWTGGEHVKQGLTLVDDIQAVGDRVLRQDAVRDSQ